MTDPFMGKLIYFRVYSGTVKKGQTVYNPRTEQSMRIGRLLHMHANHREERDVIYAGEIAATVALKDVVTGDTLCDKAQRVLLESIHFPEPVIAMAIEPKTSADRDKLFESLHRLSEEDPTFQIRSDEDTGQTIISGMGELHLEIIRDRLLREFKVGANCGEPQVAYRETVKASGDADYKFIRKAEATARHKKQTGGHGQYGHVVLKIEPREEGHGLSIESKVKGGNIPKEFIPHVEKGIRQAASTGILGGYPVVDLHVDIIDGSHHPVDSSEIAFLMAGSMAFKEAAQKAGMKLLEPIMEVEITTPEESVGSVISDVNSRRGNVMEVETTEDTARVDARIPLAELFGYTTALRTLTSGRASQSMEPSHFEPLPDAMVETIINKY